MKLETSVKVYFDDVQGMIDEVKKLQTYKMFEGDDMVFVDLDAVVAIMANHIKANKCSETPNGWISCSDRLPEDLEEVNVTWVNHNPEPYYNFVKDKPLTATAVYYKEKWYWYTSTCVDLLAEYGRNPYQEIDDGIEITAWMPLPEPWEEEE